MSDPFDEDDEDDEEETHTPRQWIPKSGLVRAPHQETP